MSSDLRLRVRDYLAAHHVATLATSGNDGPWAAAVFYVSDGYTLYFLSSPRSRHCRNLQLDPRVAVTIQADCSGWKEIKGVQLDGTVRVLAGEAEAQARRLYGEKYPLIGQLATLPAAIVEALARVCWYRIDPAHLYFIDNAKTFGSREEVELI